MGVTYSTETWGRLSGVKAGDTYRGGTFADCKCFMINANSAASKYQKEQELIMYLSSKEVQNESYLACLNVPAYVGAAAFIKQCFDEGKVTESADLFWDIYDETGRMAMTLIPTGGLRQSATPDTRSD